MEMSELKLQTMTQAEWEMRCLNSCNFYNTCTDLSQFGVTVGRGFLYMSDKTEC